MSKEAMKLALEALEWCHGGEPCGTAEAITALREALAEQPAPPVAWPCLIAEADFSEDTVTLAMQCTDYKVSAGTHWLYTSPPAQRTWVGLTLEDMETTHWSPDFRAGAKWADHKLKDKNNA